MERNDVPIPLVVLAHEDPTQRAVLETLLHQEGFHAVAHPSGEALLASLRDRLPDLFLLDLDLPGIDGSPLLDRIQAGHPHTPVVVLAGAREAPRAMEAMRAGAFECLPRLAADAQVLATVRNALEASRMARRVRILEREVAGMGYGELVGRSRVMRALFRELDRVAPSEVTVLIRGERGTGRAVVARALHQGSGRRDGPLMVARCGGVPESLLASELFGHEAGAVPEEAGARPGLLEQAHAGTAFLDGVDDLSPALRAELLRAARARAVTRVGSARERPTDFRLVMASDVPSDAAARREQGWVDIPGRSAPVELRLAPLRDRPEDIPVLAEHFIRTLDRGRSVRGLTRRALDRMLAYGWPENVRELENAVARALVTCGREIDASDLPRRVTRGGEGPDRLPPPEEGGEGPPDTLSLEELERWAVERAVEVSGGNLTEAARRLGIGRTTLYRKLGAYGLR